MRQQLGWGGDLSKTEPKGVGNCLVWAAAVSVRLVVDEMGCVSVSSLDPKAVERAANRQ